MKKSEGKDSNLVPLPRHAVTSEEHGHGYSGDDTAH